MKLVRKFRYAGPAMLLFLLFAAPAFAQFEVSPDHFDNQQAATKKNPAPKAKAQQKQQDAAKQSTNGKASTNASATANSASSKASQSSGQKNASTAAAKHSTKLQSQSKTRTLPAAQHLSATANPVPRE